MSPSERPAMLEGERNKGFEGSVDQLGNAVEKSQDAKKSVAEPAPAVKSVSYLQLFRYATPGERTQVAISLLLAIGTGACVPFFNVLYSEFTGLLAERSTAIGSSSPCHLINLFGGCQVLVNATQDARMSALRDDAVAFAVGCVGSGLVQFALAAGAVALVNSAALHQVCRIRALFLRALLRQEQAWHERRGAGNVATSLADDLEKVSEAIGEKLAMFTFLLVSFTSSITVALIAGWELTLVVLAAAPVIVVSQAIVAKVQSSLASRESESYAVAGACAEETLGAVRTVVAFAGEEVEERRYEAALAPATALGVRRGTYGGVGGGVMWLAIYCSYSLAFWYGVRLILEGRAQGDGDVQYTPAVIVIVLFGMLTGTMNLGQASPHLEAFNVGRGAAASMFEVLQRRSLVDSLGAEGRQPETVAGDIEFRGVGFRYPARPGVQVLSDFSVRVRRGQTVALVGESGSGKSTALRLAQRFFDPDTGTVTLDGVDVRSLNVAWLRRQTGVVGQEPVLFNGTIADNIRFGAPHATDDEVRDAARQAHAHAFVESLPQGYSTSVGERGAQLSGGQKQRVALARALVRRPALLLLDEPTSALDRTSEQQVQAALENASKGRTTLLVAHRLSTVRRADLIVVLSGGRVVEQGTHDELMALKGAYSRLVAAGDDDGDVDVADDANVEGATQDVDDRRPLEEWKPANGKTKDLEPAEEEDQPAAPFGRVLALSRPELGYVVVAALAAVVVGCSLPAFAVLFGGLFSVFSLEDADEVRSRTALFAVYFVALGLLSGAGTFVLTWAVSVAGARLTARLRVDALRALLRQEPAWFDLPRNAVAALASRLSADAAAVQGATGSRVAVLLQAAATLLVGFCVAASYSWRMALVSSCTVPVILGAVIAEARVVRGNDARERRALERAAAVAVEAVAQVQTVAGLAAEGAVIERYERELRTALREGGRRSRLRGVVFAMGQSVSFMCYSLSFWYGATLVADGSMPYFHVIVVAEALVFGAKMLGQALAFAPNLLTARRAAARLLALADRQTALSAPTQLVDPKTLNGDVSLEGVSFAYPTRAAACVLRALDLRVRRGQTVALVGESGSGKSTVLQLIQRLYDVSAGRVTVGECDVRAVPLAQLRANVGVVSQEPVLFARTLAENIAFGDTTRRVSLEEVVDAARQAFAHDFIQALPQGYSTLVGERGAQLSGGQKQRVALARALVRRPALLLLDEPTSALDRTTETAVHAALAAARAGRTCVTVAHRAAAAEDADAVFVLRAGAVVESGTHAQLLQRGGAYAQLHRRSKRRLADV